jgi:hypothetical protein
VVAGGWSAHRPNQPLLEQVLVGVGVGVGVVVASVVEVVVAVVVWSLQPNQPGYTR